MNRGPSRPLSAQALSRLLAVTRIQQLRSKDYKLSEAIEIVSDDFIEVPDSEARSVTPRYPLPGAAPASTRQSVGQPGGSVSGVEPAGAEGRSSGVGEPGSAASGGGSPLAGASSLQPGAESGSPGAAPGAGGPGAPDAQAGGSRYATTQGTVPRPLPARTGPNALEPLSADPQAFYKMKIIRLI